MPRHGFKRFSDIGFLQSLDKPRWLVPLLRQHEDYFQRQGLDLAGLRNDDDSARRLLKVFTQADEETPQDLLDVLYMIDDLSDDVGHDRLLQHGLQAGLDMSWSEDSMTAGDFAIAAMLHHPGLVRRCATLVARKVKNFTEYRARVDKVLTLEDASGKAGDLASALSPWFESKGRSPVCHVHPYQDGDEIRFAITHGQLYRSDGSISKSLAMQRVTFRPQQHDAVIFDNRTFTLKVNGRNNGERGLYRTAFGQVLFGDPDHLPADGGIYTLQPLRKVPLSFQPVVGVLGVALTEVWIEYDTPDERVEKYQSRDLAVSIAAEGRPNLQAGRLSRAAMMIRYTSGGRARKLEIRPPNVAIFDRDRDGEVTERFLEANEFVVKGGSPDGEDDDESDPGLGGD